MNLQICKTDSNTFFHSRYDLYKTNIWQRSLDTYVPMSKLLILGMAIPPLKGNPYNRYIKPYCVDDRTLPQETNWEFRPFRTYDITTTLQLFKNSFCLCFQSSFSSEIAGIRYHDLARGGRWTLRFLVTLDLTAFFGGTEPIVRVYWYGSPNETKITISANHHLKLPFHRNLTFVEVTLFQNKKSPNKFNLTMFGPLPNHHFATWLRIATWATKKKNSYFPLIPGCFIRVLAMFYDKNPNITGKYVSSPI